MRRRALFASLLLLAASAPLAAGCFDTSPVYLPNGAECGGVTPEDALPCEGSVCLVLTNNQQGMAGMCSASCESDVNCTLADRCVQIQNQGPFCLRACESDEDCFDAFVCRLANTGGEKFCLVDPVGP